LRKAAWESTLPPGSKALLSKGLFSDLDMAIFVAVALAANVASVEYWKKSWFELEEYRFVYEDA